MNGLGKSDNMVDNLVSFGNTIKCLIDTDKISVARRTLSLQCHT